MLALSTVFFLLNIFTIPTIIIYTIFVINLWFSKKHHPFNNIIFLILALGIYLIPIPPIGWGLFRVLKEFRIASFNINVGSIFFIAPLIFISLSFRNIVDNILAYFKTSTFLRNVYFFISSFIVFIALLAYPFFDNVKLRNQAILSNGTGDLSTIVIRQTITFIDQYHNEDGFTARFDSSTKKYIYRLRLTKPLDQDLKFMKVETDGEKINFTTDGRVNCFGCQKNLNTPNNLIFPAGKDIDFIITSDRMIKAINFTEPGDKVDEFVFWK